MGVETVRKQCLKKKEVTEGFPFDEDTLVFKVAGKMFCLANLTPPYSITLKCKPEDSLEYREKYDSVTPGYHTNKKHWITIQLDGTVPPQEIKKWIDDSYDLVIESLPVKIRNKIRGTQRG